MKVVGLLVLIVLISLQAESFESEGSNEQKPRILIFTLMVGSHIQEFKKIAKQIVDTGKYDVWMAFAENSSHFEYFAGTNIKPIFIAGYTQKYLDELMNQFSVEQKNDVFTVIESMNSYMQFLSSDQEVVKQIKQLKFDLFLSEHYTSFLVLKQMFEIPKQLAMSLTPFDQGLSIYQGEVFQHTSLYSQYTSVLIGTDPEDGKNARNSFGQRFKNLIGLFLRKCLDFFVYKKMMLQYLNDQDSKLIYTFQQADLYVAKGIDGLTTQIPLRPNFKYSYPLMNSEDTDNSEMDTTLVEFLKKSKQVIFICFGTTFIPMQHQLEELFKYNLANKNYQYVVIFQESLVNQTLLEMINSQKHIYIAQWVPQSLLLREPKVKIFFTHGGHNSMLEVIESGTAAISYPLSETDQRRNCEVMQEIGVGVCLEDMTFDQIHKAVTKIEKENYFEENTQRYSKVVEMKKQEKEDLIYWIDYLLAIDPEPIAAQQSYGMNLLLLKCEQVVLLIQIKMIRLCNFLADWVPDLLFNVQDHHSNQKGIFLDFSLFCFSWNFFCSSMKEVWSCQRMDLDIKLPIIFGLVALRLTLMNALRRWCCKKKKQEEK